MIWCILNAVHLIDYTNKVWFQLPCQLLLSKPVMQWCLRTADYKITINTSFCCHIDSLTSQNCSHMFLINSVDFYWVLYIYIRARISDALWAPKFCTCAVINLSFYPVLLLYRKSVRTNLGLWYYRLLLNSLLYLHITD